MDQPSDSDEGPKTLAIDIGGSGLKAALLDRKGRMLTDKVRIPTPDKATPEALLEHLVALVEPLSAYDRVSVGFPGYVRDGCVFTAPNFDHVTWPTFPLAQRLSDLLGKPVRMLNDADVQGYGAIHGEGLEFVITLGTGVGTALFRNGELMPHMEFAQVPVRKKKKTFNHLIGDVARKEIKAGKWNERVLWTIDWFRTLINFDRMYIGGGNAKKLKLDLPGDIRIVPNRAGLTGGIRLWEHLFPARQEDAF